MTRNTYPKLDRKKGLYLKDTGTEKGRGVFCTSPIKAGEELEVTAAVVLDDGDTKTADKTLLKNYTFVIGKVSARLRQRMKIKSSQNASSVVMGILSFCNHDKKPNAEILWEEHAGTVYYTLRATRNIPKNTEICTTYGAQWFNQRGQARK